MTVIDEREEQLRNQGYDLGPPRTNEKPFTRIHYRAFENACLVDIPGVGVYVWPEATVAHLFDPKPEPEEEVPPAEPPLSTDLVLTMDVSSYQGPSIEGLLATHRPGHVIPKLYLPLEHYPGSMNDPLKAPGMTVVQARSARNFGATVGGYVWCYASVEPRQTVRSALQTAFLAGITLPILWLDLEPYEDGTCPDVPWIEEAVDEAVTRGIPVGFYTGPWVWERLGNPRRFNHLPLWTAEYNGQADLTTVTLYGGWWKAAGHQYTSDPVDLSVLDRTYTIAA